MSRKIALFVLMVTAITAFGSIQSNAHPRHHRVVRVLTPRVRVVVSAPPVVIVRNNYCRPGYIRPHCRQHRYYSYHRGGGNRRYCR